jgi:hypothetical protein
MSEKITTRNGFPTKSSIYKICEKHGLIHHEMNVFPARETQTLVYGGRRGADDAAKAVAKEFNERGFVVEQRDYSADLCRNGSLTFKKATALSAINDLLKD